MAAYNVFGFQSCALKSHAQSHASSRGQSPDRSHDTSHDTSHDLLTQHLLRSKDLKVRLARDIYGGDLIVSARDSPFSTILKRIL